MSSTADPAASVERRVRDDARSVDVEIGRVRERLDRCGPRGNHMDERHLCRLEGRSEALHGILDLIAEERGA